MKNPHALGPIILIIGLLFGLAETWYFGWNWLPTNNLEFLCDLCTVFIASIGAFLSSASIAHRLIG